MNNAYILVSYQSFNGGINNLQIAKVVEPSTYRGLVNIIKVFSSQKHKAEDYAKKYLKKLNK